MEKDIKEKWIAALRSGKYKQGKSVMHKQVNGIDYYCCLGVLCEVAVEEGFIDAPKVEYVGPKGYKVFNYDNGNGVYLLPNRVVEWSKLGSYTGVFPVSKNKLNEGSLSGKNDAGKSFDEIADLIEKYF